MGSRKETRPRTTTRRNSPPQKPQQNRQPTKQPMEIQPPRPSLENPQKRRMVKMTKKYYAPTEAKKIVKEFMRQGLMYEPAKEIYKFTKTIPKPRKTA